MTREMEEKVQAEMFTKVSMDLGRHTLDSLAGAYEAPAETMKAVELAFDIGDKVIDVSTMEIAKRATLDPANVVESTDGEGWHVLCMPEDVKKAAKALANHVVEELNRRMYRLRDAKINVRFAESLILADDVWSSIPGGDK